MADVQRARQHAIGYVPEEAKNGRRRRKGADAECVEEVRHQPGDHLEDAGDAGFGFGRCRLRSRTPRVESPADDIEEPEHGQGGQQQEDGLRHARDDTDQGFPTEAQR